MSNNDEHFPKWLEVFTLPVPTAKHDTPALSRVTKTPVPEMNEILKIASFEPWTDFDASAVKRGEELESISDAMRSSVNLFLKLHNGGRLVENTNYQQATHPSPVGAEATAGEFDGLIQVARAALYIVPALKQGLLCEPDEIKTTICQATSCSDYLEMLPKTCTNEIEIDSSQERCAGSSRDMTRIVTPDISLRNARHKPPRMPLLTVETKRPTLRIAALLGISGQSRVSIDMGIRTLFGRIRCGAEDLDSLEDVLSTAICEAIVYALHAESEYGILTNYNETIFFRILRVKNEPKEPRELHIAVSSLYNGRSLFCGLVACLKEVFSKDYSSTVNWEDRADFLTMLNSEDPDYEPDESGSHVFADGSTAASGVEKESSTRKRRRTGRHSESRARRFQHDEGIRAGGSPSSVIHPLSEKEMSGSPAQDYKSKARISLAWRL